MKKAPKRIITLERIFRCATCGRVEAFGAGANPIHCDRKMDPEQELFRGGDPDMLRLDLVQLRSVKRALVDQATGVADREDGFGASYFRVPNHWEPAYTVWILRPGREAGERLGWFGQGLLAWEYQMVPGLRVTTGVCPTKEDVIGLFWATINDYGPGPSA